MKKDKAVFLDRDGTINKDKNYLYKVDEFEFLPGVIDGLKVLSNLDYKLIIVTNQSGIARGYYTEDDYLKLNEWMINELKLEGIEILASYYCPHYPNGIVEKYRCNCLCRKPQLELYEKAISEHTLDIKKCIAIGDKERDIAISKKYSIPGFQIYADETSSINNIWKITGGLLEAAEIVRDAFRNK